MERSPEVFDARARRNAYMREWQRRRRAAVREELGAPPSLATKRAPNHVQPGGVRRRPKAASEAERVARRRDAARRYYASDPEKQRRLVREYNARNRDRCAARSAISTAVCRGKIVRPDACSKCQTPGPVQAHHHNGYAEKLDVVWLCRRCHFEADKALGSFAKKKQEGTRAA